MRCQATDIGCMRLLHPQEIQHAPVRARSSERHPGEAQKAGGVGRYSECFHKSCLDKIKILLGIVNRCRLPLTLRQVRCLPLRGPRRPRIMASTRMRKVFLLMNMRVSMSVGVPMRMAVVPHNTSPNQ